MLSLFTLSIFVFLIYFTYISNGISSFKKPYYENIKTWLFELKKDDNKLFTLSWYTDSSEISVLKINLSDKIIFSSWSVKTSTSSWNTIISITNWIYFFDLKEINTNYIITGSWFEIDNKWPGSFIINNLNQKKNLIFSLNSVLDINLKHYKENTEITSLDLYPHTYLLFNPIKNIFVKNSDLLKISQTFDIWYFNNTIFNENNEINESFVNMVTIRKEEGKKLINNSLLLISQELKDTKKTINNFLKSNFGLLPGETLINKYFITLKNPNKKSLYFKNLIIRNLHDLIEDDEINKKNINEIYTNIVLLKEIDSVWYNEIKNIINFYYKTIIQSNNNVSLKINLTKLINKINNNSIINDSSLVYLEKVFLEYDFNEKIDFYKEFSTFRLKFFDDINIDLSKDNNTSLYNIEKVDYLLFFMENILMSDFASSSNGSEDLLNIFSDYINIANNFYSNNNNKTKRTWIFTYSKILNNFVKILKNKYFLEERNENMLLVMNPDNIISNNDLTNFKENIKKIIWFYNNNLNILNSDTNNKDKFIIKLYSSLTKKFDEFFMALDNYAEYVIEYDKTKKELLTTSSINEWTDILVLSYSHASNYLNNFNWIWLKYANISIMDYNYCKDPRLENAEQPVEVPYCYKIDNLLIDSKNVSFLLFPFEKNKIEEITVESEVKLWSYKLDEIEIELEKKKKTETKDKDKYEFKNFLAYTFWQQIINNSNNWENNNNLDENQILEEDSIVKIFKRNKLLWDSWDFVSLKWFLDIDYNNLLVINTGNAYSINVKLWIFNVDLWRNKTYYWEFSSMYNFSPNHSFINPRIKLIDKKNEKDLLLWNYVYITWEYKVNLINEEIKKVFNKYDEISFIVENIRQNSNNFNIKIIYLKDSEKVLFETTYNEEKINITLDNWNITSFTYGKENKLENEIPYTELTKIFNNIK